MTIAVNHLASFHGRLDSLAVGNALHLGILFRFGSGRRCRHCGRALGGVHFFKLVAIAIALGRTLVALLLLLRKPVRNQLACFKPYHECVMSAYCTHTAATVQ
jgi:hypothetical protein